MIEGMAHCYLRLIEKGTRCNDSKTRGGRW